MDTNNRIIRIIAAMELVLIFPAALFLLAVVARHIEIIGPPARQIALWYAYRFWTLWVFMISMPLTALFIGCATLLRNPNGGIRGRQTIRQRLVAIHKSVPKLLIAASTLAASLILVVVALHMLAN